MRPAASVIIPTYNHGNTLGQAIDSALAQTVLVEVIVVDDGSTDNTPDVLAKYGSRIRTLRIEHSGPSAARNAGIEAASAEFLMLLDADDVIAPEKVELQLLEFTDDIGWVLCDVRIEDAATGRAENASDRYHYAEKEIGGWIQPHLTVGNFIPIMSPLVRRSALGSIRFRDDRVPEDWHFWHQLAGVARVRYLPKVLATYRKSRTGRSRIPVKSRVVSPNIEHPLRLNLGCGTPHTRSWHPIKGFVNLDKSLGWRFEDGLGDFMDGSVAGITVSHSLMYVRIEDWPALFNEFARVLMPGGVARVTEDDAMNPASSRFGGWKGSEPAVTLINADLVREHMERAGLAAFEVTADTTRYRDGSLRQAQHGAPPDVFFVEGVRQSAVLLTPHADDEVLFAAFQILRYRPRVVICCPSVRDYGDTKVRFAETCDAVGLLGGGPVEQWAVSDLVKAMRELDARVRPTIVLAPAMRCSHPDHLAVAEAARAVFGDRVRAFHTYDERGKVREGTEAAYEPEWIEQKLRALARYSSQLQHPRAHRFFMDDLREYVE